jgi:hypothetical protein
MAAKPTAGPLAFLRALPGIPVSPAGAGAHAPDPSRATRQAAALVGLLLIGAIAGAPARAQSSGTFGETLQRVGEDYAERYAAPVVDAAGAGLNSGLFHTAGVGNGLVPGVDLYLSVKAFGTQVPDADRSLSLRYQTQESITLSDGRQCTSRGDVTYEIDGAPTAFGERDPGTVSAEGIFECDDGTVVDSSATLDLLPGVFDSGIAPLAVPQAGVGLPLTGTHVMVRYLPNIRYRDYGTVGFIGGGVRQEVGRFLPFMPLDVSVYGFYQSLTIAGEDDVDASVDASAVAGGLSVSKTVLLFTFYGGLQAERTTADLNYTFEPTGDLAPQNIGTSFTGANTVRALAGVSVGLGPVVLSADLSQGQRSVVSAGLGLSL